MTRKGPWTDTSRFPWLVYGVILAVFAGLALGSAVTYLQVSEAHALPYLEVSQSVAFSGVVNGTLADNGTVRMWLNVTVVNPSPRDLYFNTVIHKVWLVDAPRDAGLPGFSNDVLYANDTGTYWLAPITLWFGSYVPNFTLPSPAGGEGTARVVLDLTSGVDAASFKAVQNITAYAAQHTGGLDTAVWAVFIETSLNIQGVPPPQSLAVGDYLREVARVILQQGPDIPGVAIGGP